MKIATIWFHSLLLLFLCGTLFGCHSSKYAKPKQDNPRVRYTVSELEENDDLVNYLRQQAVTVYTTEKEWKTGSFQDIRNDSLVLILDEDKRQYSIHENRVKFLRLTLNDGGLEGHRIVEIAAVVIGVGFIIFALHQLGTAY